MPLTSCVILEEIGVEIKKECQTMERQRTQMAQKNLSGLDVNQMKTPSARECNEEEAL
jgi:hypothetical protein